ncbi:hypothetical protein HG1285_03884 [Hydrogenivirga sp. 128-5-R1-1]|nr:hypothetical protein HG1285_03884 [Hydrogenivirga sp. 128-5-R1-1]
MICVEYVSEKELQEEKSQELKRPAGKEDIR